MSYLLALDQGTTSSRAIVFSDRLDVIAIAQQPIRQIFPEPGWVEHDPNEIWETQLAVAREALRRAAIDTSRIAAIGITNQRETAVFWDRVSGETLGNAIVWQDRRATVLCEELRRAGAEDAIQRSSGLVLDPYFSAGKIRWLLDNDTAARNLAAAGRLAFGTIDSWLMYRLSRGTAHVTDASNASRTQLYDLASGTWSDELLRLWAIPKSILPRIVDSSGSCAETDLFGGHRLPIAGIAGDQQAALFGQCCFHAGMAKCTYGTGCFILLHTGFAPVRSRSRLLSTVAWSISGQREFALEGSVFNGGATVQWLRDGLGLIDSAAEIEPLAASVADSGGVTLVPAFTGLGAPHWDPHARGALFGLTRGTSRAQIARAALEGIAMQVADVCEAMTADCGAALTELRVDGGAAGNDLLMRIQADYLDTPLSRSAMAEGTALGAACLAGLGVGLWSGRDELAALWREQHRFLPKLDRATVQDRRARWHDSVRAARGWSSTHHNDASSMESRES